MTRIHPDAEVSKDATIGEGCLIWKDVQVREGAKLGTKCILGKGSYVDVHVTVGNNVSQSVMAMAQLEEQAQVNYYAYCAEGADHTHLSEAEMSEVTNTVPIWELPHFREVLRGRERQRDGVWAYHEMLATTELFDT